MKGGGEENKKREVDVPPEGTDIEGVTERANEEGETGAEDCERSERDAAELVGERHTVADTAANETGKGEEAVENAVCSIGEGDILETSCTKVGDGTEHAYGGKAGEHESTRARAKMNNGTDQVMPTRTTCAIGVLESSRGEYMRAHTRREGCTHVYHAGNLN